MKKQQKEQDKHTIWLTCMQLSNCTPQQAVNFIKNAEPFLEQPITSTGQNILMVASSVGAHYVVKECLMHGAKINNADLAGRTALHYAASIGNINIFQQLINQGAHPLKQTIGGQTPLTKACIFCQGEIIQWYLNNCLQAFSISDNFGKKPLQMLKLQGEDLFAEVSTIYQQLTQSQMKD